MRDPPKKTDMTRDAMRDFIAHHDDRWLFVVVYVTMAVVLSLLLSLFWLVVVAALHFGLECMRQALHRDGTWDVVTHATWEVKLDVALVLLALAMALYMDVVLGVLGLQSVARATAASRAGMRVARFAAWQRNVRAIILLGDDVARIIHIGISRVLRRPAPARVELSLAASEAGAAPEARHVAGAAGAPAAFGIAPPAGPGRAGEPRSWRHEWSRGDRFTIGLLAAAAVLILLAPLLTDHTWLGATQALAGELRPFPTR